MASKSSTTLALFIVINLLILNLVTPVFADDYCPIDSFKLSTCANILNMINLNIGKLAMKPCCSMLSGLMDLDVALCLCTALKFSILGMTMYTPLHLNLALDACGSNLPDGFQCPTDT
ncbi:putative lipid-binding protein AIR1B [Cardamine amara subsp. amara]|uniref:Lipid-binding protein AIR1B n=1 Tax=Cardamine amara subsp. amara TaxID=228776 RepID=A0ABD0ZLN6_CARAN